MPRDKQEVFNEIYEMLEKGKPIPVELQGEAENHGIRVHCIGNAVLASQEVDCDDE